MPTNRLIQYVLDDWALQNADTLTNDDARDRLAERITQVYLKNRLI